MKNVALTSETKWNNAVAIEKKDLPCPPVCDWYTLTIYSRASRHKTSGFLRAVSCFETLSEPCIFTPWSIGMYCFVRFLFKVIPFVSVYKGLLGMSDLPVQSMTTGGVLWFTDLTVCDPLHYLPVATALTFLLQFEVSCCNLFISHGSGADIGLPLYPRPSVLGGQNLRFTPIPVITDWNHSGCRHL